MCLWVLRLRKKRRLRVDSGMPKTGFERVWDRIVWCDGETSLVNHTTSLSSGMVAILSIDLGIPMIQIDQVDSRW